MLNRLMSGWSFQRGFYLVAGLMMIIIAGIDGLWIGVVAGGYFAAMGLFAFGCAGGRCDHQAFDTEEHLSKK